MFNKRQKATRPATRKVYIPLPGDETRLARWIDSNHRKIRTWDDQEKLIKQGLKELNIDDKYYESLFTFASGYLNTPFYFEYETAFKQGGILNKKFTFKDLFK